MKIYRKTISLITKVKNNQRYIKWKLTRLCKTEKKNKRKIHTNEENYKKTKDTLTFLKRASMQSTITFAYFVSSFAISVNVLITILLLMVRVTSVSMYFSATSRAIPVSLLPAILPGGGRCFSEVEQEHVFPVQHLVPLWQDGAACQPSLSGPTR